MSEALGYWDDREAVAGKAVEYAKAQKESFIMRLLGQLALPIEAAMADEDQDTVGPAA